MNFQRHWLMTGAAVIAALGVGFGAAQLMKPSAAFPEADPEEGHEEARGAVVALTPDKAAVLEEASSHLNDGDPSSRNSKHLRRRRAGRCQ